MTYGELRTLFKTILDRDDCTDADADGYLSLGLNRTERVLRTRFQRSTISVTVDETFPGYLSVPADYLGVYRMSVDEKPLVRIHPSQVAMFRGFRLDEDKFYFEPEVEEGQTIKLIYYSEFDDSIADTSSYNYTAHLADVIAYAALIYAGDVFMDQRRTDWSNTFIGLTEEAQIASDMETFSGGLAVTPYGVGVA